MRDQTDTQKVLPEWAITIKQARLDLGESMEKFGARFGVTKMAVSYWESGQADPPATVLMFSLKQTKGDTNA